ncbi:ribosomal protein L11 methyltransferase [Striga asiatica]|uniref:Ribosomal protein L11 methyltransferase n=1 Tax=Striga asiatica TaxID=4170 RepID=A0A5A7Q4Q1_STRAF|nr:ribosomal protein L11 methyltransferase [Striga asiatica]
MTTRNKVAASLRPPEPLADAEFLKKLELRQENSRPNSGRQSPSAACLKAGILARLPYASSEHPPHAAGRNTNTHIHNDQNTTIDRCRDPKGCPTVAAPPLALEHAARRLGEKTYDGSELMKEGGRREDTAADDEGCGSGRRTASVGSRLMAAALPAADCGLRGRDDGKWASAVHRQIC